MFTVLSDIKDQPMAPNGLVVRQKTHFLFNEKDLKRSSNVGQMVIHGQVSNGWRMDKLWEQRKTNRQAFDRRDYIMNCFTEFLTTLTLFGHIQMEIELLQSRVSFASLHIIFLCCCFYFAYSRKFTCGFVVNLYSSLQQGSQIWIKTILDNKTFVFLFYLWYIKILFSFFVMLSLLFLFLQYRKSKWKLQINSVTTDNSGNYTCIITNPSGQLKWTYTLRVLGKSLKTFNRLRQGINFNFYGRVCFETLFWNH